MRKALCPSATPNRTCLLSYGIGLADDAVCRISADRTYQVLAGRLHDGGYSQGGAFAGGQYLLALSHVAQDHPVASFASDHGGSVTAGVERCKPLAPDTGA